MKCTNMKELIAEYKRLHPTWHYFDKKTLEFFGEDIDKMDFLGTETVYDFLGNEIEVYVVNRLQEKHPLGPKYTKAYFSVDTLVDLSAYTKDGEML